MNAPGDDNPAGQDPAGGSSPGSASEWAYTWASGEGAAAGPKPSLDELRVAVEEVLTAPPPPPKKRSRRPKKAQAPVEVEVEVETGIETDEDAFPDFLVGDPVKETWEEHKPKKKKRSSGPQWSSKEFREEKPKREKRNGVTQIDPDADVEAQAKDICLRLLTGQAKSRGQLAEALKKRGVPADVSGRVLDRFTELGLINDAAFAEAWVEGRHRGRGLARRALAQELRQKGVDQELVAEAVERLDPDQEEETARALVARKLAATRGLDRQKRISRLAGMLARKGYNGGTAIKVVREAIEAEGQDADGLDDHSW